MIDEAPVTDEDAETAAAAYRALRAEADAQAPPPAGDGHPDGTITVQLAGHDVHILPSRLWRSRANNALMMGDFETWASMCLAGDDYERVWLAVDPTMEQVIAMTDQWKARTGITPGKSRSSMPSYMRGLAR